jgi:hypothetical protein
VTPRIFTVLVLALQFAVSAGCGLRYRELGHRGVVPLSYVNSPATQRAEGGNRIEVQSTFAGETQTFRYDGTLWRFAKLPYVRADNRDLVMLDTGMSTDIARATLDVVRGGKHPAHLSKDLRFAYVRSLKMGKVEARELLVTVELGTWQFHVLGLTIYHLRGWILGMPLLAQAKYLAFDNPKARVTIGFEPFAPSPKLKWRHYPLEFREGDPWVRLPVAGQEVDFVADSGGGPRLILNAEQWQQITGRVRIKGRSKGRFPTWGGHRDVDVYRVRDLRIGPVKRGREEIWVRRGQPLPGEAPTFGLGLFEDAVAVWDVHGRRFWVGRRAGK